VIDKVY
jgi:hypothetical protein